MLPAKDIMEKAEGFTLIEILVATTIIAILAIFALVAYNNTRISARDAARKSVAETIAKAEELYENQNNDYSADIGDTNANCVGAALDTLVGANLMGCPKQRARSGGADVSWDSVYTHINSSSWSLTTELEKGGSFSCDQEGCR